MHGSVTKAIQRLLIGVVSAGGLFALILFVTWKVMFPYGHRPAVLRSMYFALMTYASDHNGKFPDDSTDNYSALRKLYPQYVKKPMELAGVSGNAQKMERALKEGVALNNSCTSWVYVPGLTTNDDPRIAILWESKEGLFPNGKRNKFGGRAVLLLGGVITNVPSDAWSDFLKNQSELRNLRR